MGSSQSNEGKYNFILIGKTGTGKSCTGNAIVGEENCFCPFTQTTAYSKTIKKCEIPRWGKKINIIDTPGVKDTDLDLFEDVEFTRKNMTKALKVCPDGVRAFLIVLHVTQKYSKEDKDVMLILSETFGNELFNNIVLIFTHGDNFDAERNITRPEDSQAKFSSWCRATEGELRMLLQKCNFRAVLFHNKGYEQKKRDVEMLTLFKKCEEIRHQYTHLHFDRNETRRSMLILNNFIEELQQKIIDELDVLRNDFFLLKSQKEVLIESANKLLQEMKENKRSFPDPHTVTEAVSKFVSDFGNIKTNEEKFKFLKSFLYDVNGRAQQQLTLLSADIKKVVNPERHKSQLKRNICELLQYIKEQARGTNKLELEEERVKMFLKEVEDLDIEGRIKITEVE